MFKTEIPENWLNKLNEEIDKLGIKQKDGKHSNTCETGELYIQLIGATPEAFTMFNIISTGEKYKTQARCYLTKEAALNVLQKEILNYAKDKVGMLYWRAEPEVDCFDAFNTVDCTGKQIEVWVCYARLIITDKPRIR